MMKGYFLFPSKTLFGKPIPKIKIYQFSDLNSATKEKFVSEVDKIIWQHKLSKKTTNLAGTKEVPEIQIFNIYAKEKEVSSAPSRARPSFWRFSILLATNRPLSAH